jgi:hypothetical protein
MKLTIVVKIHSGNSVCSEFYPLHICCAKEISSIDVISANRPFFSLLGYNEICTKKQGDC